VIFVGGMLRAMLGRFPAAVLMGVALGGLAWLLVASMLIAGLAGLLAFVIVLLGGGARFGGYGEADLEAGAPSAAGEGGFGGGGASGRW